MRKISDNTNRIIHGILGMVLNFFYFFVSYVYVKKEFPTKDIWLYTGYVYEDLNDLQRKVLENVDVLIDGPYIQEQRDITLPFRGSKNQRILYMKDLR